jgi:hypothetical protein
VHWPYSKPFKNISCADVFAFSYSSMPKSTRFARQLSTIVCVNSKLLTQTMIHSFHFVLLSAFPRNKKARTVRAGFVTPSGFKPETF